MFKYSSNYLSLMGSSPTSLTSYQRRRERLLDFLSTRKSLITLTLFPVGILLTVVYIIPILWAIAAGFHSITAFSPEWNWTGLANYGTILKSDDFRASVWRGGVFAVGSTILQLVTGVGIALLINREFRYQHMARTLIMLPYLVPTAILGFVLVWMGNSQFGVINQLLFRVGLIDEYVAFFGHPDLAMPSLIVGTSWKFSIFVTIMVLARLQSIPSDHYEAARMSGANRYQVFRDIILPNIKGVIFIVLLLRGVWMFNKFDIIWVTTRGGPLEKTTTAAIYVYQIAFQHASLGLAAAISTVLFLMLFAAALVYFHFFQPSTAVNVE